MTVIRIQGGLGNQLFQWAAGVHLKRTRGVAIRFDVSWFHHCSHHDTPRPLEIRELLDSWGGVVRYPRRLADKIYSPSNPLHTVEDHRVVGSMTYVGRGWLSGYFQDYGIVEAVSDDIVGAMAKADLIAPAVDQDQCAMHVRLGDYYHDPRTREHHGVLGPEYYARALAGIDSGHLRKPVKVFTDSPHVFTDEYLPHLGGVNVELAMADGGRDVLQQMSAAGALVISNSSLSWWAGFAATRTDSGAQVVYPRTWLACKSHFDRRIGGRDWIVVSRGVAA